MSKKVSTCFPSYQLRDKRIDGRNVVWFVEKDRFYVCWFPILGMTVTQEQVLRMLAAQRTAPVVSISHEKPVSVSGPDFGDPQDNHITYRPYAVTIATVEVLNEKVPRKYRVCFCDISLHESNAHNVAHNDSRGVYIIAL